MAMEIHINTLYFQIQFFGNIGVLERDKSFWFATMAVITNDMTF